MMAIYKKIQTKPDKTQNKQTNPSPHQTKQENINKRI